MSPDHTGSRALNRLSRRRVLTIAATVGVGAAGASVAGLSLAADNRTESKKDEALVLSLRDAKSGTFDVFVGARRVKLKDADLAARLIKIAERG
jgi:hypothetical protein